MVKRSEVVKRYEYEDGKYVLLDPEEIKKVAPQSARSMDILGFVKESDIDPLYFDASYFLVADPEGKKGYQLLLKALEDAKRVGIAKITMHQREYTCFLRPFDHGLALHTMHLANEIREAPGYGRKEGVKLMPEEIKLAEQLVETLSEKFQPEKYRDEFEEKLNNLIEARRKEKDVAAAPMQQRANVIDMMTALMKSLAASGAHAKQTGRAGSSPIEPRRALGRHRRTLHTAAS